MAAHAKIFLLAMSIARAAHEKMSITNIQDQEIFSLNFLCKENFPIFGQCFRANPEYSRNMIMNEHESRNIRNISVIPYLIKFVWSVFGVDKREFAVGRECVLNKQSFFWDVAVALYG